MKETERFGAERVLAGVIDAVVSSLPGDVPRRVAAALSGVGVTGCEVLIVDYGQEVLVDLASDQNRQPVDDTPAGRVFRTQQPDSEDTEAGVRMWIPLTDLGTRLGVIAFDRAEWDRTVDAVARRVATLVSKAIVSGQRRTDLLTVRRRHRDMTMSADLQWQVLPPTTFVHESFTVGGVLEPAYENGGDAFDYAYTAGLLSFAVLDAMGHGEKASIMAAVALASLRHSRSSGLDLSESRIEADRTIATIFGDFYYVTALLGAYDPRSRTLRVLVAGHPLALIVRAGAVTELACAPSRPLGLGGPTREVATAVLAPGDAVVAYTDGVTEAVDRPTPTQAQHRLESLITAHHHPGELLAETLRLIARGVLDMNHGELRDDATMLMLLVPPTEPSDGRRG